MNITGLSKETFENLQVDAGVAIANLGINKSTAPTEFIELLETARTDKTKNLGATDGGFHFQASATTRQPSVDGLRSGVKGMTLTNSVEVHLSFTSKEITPERWAMAIGNATITTPTEGVTVVTPKLEFDAESYTNEVCFIGSMADQKRIAVIQLLNVLNTTGVNFQSNNMGEGTLAFDMFAHLEDPWDTSPPYKIYYFDISNAIEQEPAMASATKIGASKAKSTKEPTPSLFGEDNL